MRNYECTVSIPIGDDMIDLEVAYEAYYMPAKISGPPESCYPAEGELNIVSIFPRLKLTNEQKEAIDDKCWNHYHNQRRE